MEAGTTEWTLVIARLEKLEKQNRRMKQIGLAALVLIGSVLLMGQATKPRTIEAERIMIRDSHGRTRITIGTPEFSGIAIGTKPSDPVIWLTDENGTDRAMLTLDGLRFANGRAKPLADFGNNQAILRDSNGKVL